MARGRSILDYERVYVDGYDLNAYIIDCGTRGITRQVADSTCLADTGGGSLPGKILAKFGPINGVFDNTATTGLHVLSATATGNRRYIMHARGGQAVPAIGDDAYCIVVNQIAYMATASDGTSTVTIDVDPDAIIGLNYTQYFGALLHAYGSETGANSANTNHDNGAATTAGGWLMYQIRSITGAGTVTISVDDSANGSTWLALSGATSGAIATASAPTAGIIQLATTATVRQYLRWQIAFGSSATACVFTLAFMRQ